MRVYLNGTALSFGEARSDRLYDCIYSVSRAMFRLKWNHGGPWPQNDAIKSSFNRPSKNSTAPGNEKRPHGYILECVPTDGRHASGDALDSRCFYKINKLPQVLV